MLKMAMSLMLMSEFLINVSGHALTAVVVVAVFSSCVVVNNAGSAKHPSADLNHLSNADIFWHGSIGGLHPILASKKAQWSQGKSDKDLIVLLSDPNAFVAAHVLLSIRHSDVSLRAAKTDNPQWNGLLVDLGPHGRTEISTAQRFRLAREWSASLSSRKSRL